MTGPIVQIPYLRDLPIHEGAGLQQAGGEDQLGQLAKLLMLKGHLALEQEKFQSEEQERKQKKQTLAGLNQGLSQALAAPGVMDSPQGLAGAFQQMIPQLAGAGMGPEAASLAGKLPGLQESQRLTNEQRVLHSIVDEFKTQNMQDPKVQERTMMNLYAVNQEAARSFAQDLQSMHGRFEWTLDGAGQWWKKDNVTGALSQGPLGTATGRGGTNAITTQEAIDTAKLLATSLTNVESAYAKDKTVTQVPWAYAGISNAKATGGAMGAIAGLIEPFAQGQLTPGQKNVMRDRDMIIETYMALITGKRGAGSPGLLSIARNSLFPTAGQDEPEVQDHASKIRRTVIKIATELANGGHPDMTQLPGYMQYIREQLNVGAEGATPNVPGGLGQAPLGFNDLLKGVPSAPPPQP